MAHFVQALALLAAAGLACAADFSHRAHLGMGLECATCHTIAASSTRVEDNILPSKAVCLRCHQDATIKQPSTTAVAHFNHQLHAKIRPCTGCHQVQDKATFPAMATCMGCHRTSNIPEDCWKCHAQTMKLMPADHVTDFLDSHSRVKHSAAQKQSCEVCHGNNFHCAGCH